MTAVEWAERYVVFEKSSPVTGAFHLPKYPFLRRPLRSLDDVSKKQTVIYKASSVLGTVFLQIATAFRLDRRPGDMLLVAQSDDDSADWSKTRIRPFIERIEPLTSMRKNDKNAFTNDLFQWPHQFAIITGPGVNSQNSKQVRYVHTDEGHLYRSGALAAFDKRMGGRWDRSGLHVSTAANEGADIDAMYHEGAQNEWHHRCQCGELVWLLWRESAKAHYGREVLRWRECASETESLSTIHLVCPHCGAEYQDTPRARFALVEHGDYVPLNPNAEPSKESFRWNCFAASWIAWSGILAEHFQAMRAARIGDLSKHEDFVKKRECRSYTPELPDLGEAVAGRDYRIGEIWIVSEDKKRTASFDVQDAGGLHFWGQADEYSLSGASRRVCYSRLTTWEQCREFQIYHSVHSHDTFCDYGHRDREVFARCAEWEWYALASTDDSEFMHYISQGAGQQKLGFPKPYSSTQAQDSMSGRKKLELLRHPPGRLPEGFCYSRLWSKPVVAGILYRLKGGVSGRYYGIATDINGEYISQLHSYVPSSVRNKTTGAMKLIWRQVKKDDHAFATSSMCLVGAMIAGYFPMDFAIPAPSEEKIEEITLLA